MNATMDGIGHVHGCCFDPFENRIWLTIGDQKHAAILYTDVITDFNDVVNVNWNKISLTETSLGRVQMVSVFAAKNGIIFGSDSNKNGIYVLSRNEYSVSNFVRKYIITPNEQTVISFMPGKMYNFNGLTYICCDYYLGIDYKRNFILTTKDFNSYSVIYESSENISLSAYTMRIANLESEIAIYDGGLGKTLITQKITKMSSKISQLTSLSELDGSEVIPAVKSGSNYKTTIQVLFANAMKVILAAGTAIAGTAPLKFLSGVLLTAPESGAVEFDGKTFYFTTSNERFEISSYNGANASGANLFIGGGGKNSIGASGQTYKGSNNTSLGVKALGLLTTGYGNMAIGKEALYPNTTGVQNTAVGAYCLKKNTTGNSNTGIGESCMAGMLTGIGNVSIGQTAGRFIADGTTENTASTYCLFIGNDSKLKSAGNANSIVIGHSAIGAGSNTAVIGNSDVTDVYFGSESGAAKITASKANFTAIPTSADGLSSGDVWNNGGVLTIMS